MELLFYSANAGGMLGLAIGFSIVSIIEPLYFLTIRHFSSSQTQDEKVAIKISSKQPLKIVCRPKTFGYLP